ncbi:hypothetical protein AB1Y20_002749 [Prymnesium parvum]|uniref:Nucleotide-diphospho-sugar transferase domain-containing protein n=1 Tax=Prymnesium parvum TaxID=97485 RepID=A0AB34JBH7_PRYPA
MASLLAAALLAYFGSPHLAQAATRTEWTHAQPQHSLLDPSPLLPLPSPPPPPPLPPPPLSAPSPPPPPCDEDAECAVAQLVHRHAEDGTVVVTFTNSRQRRFTHNWAYHLLRAGVRGLLVGVMNARRGEEAYEALAAPLRARGVGVYAVNSREVRASPQGGRWFHVLPLLRTGARVLLSDSDVVWLRDPRPYLRQLERLHPRLDFSVSSDQQHATDGKPLRRFRRRRGRRFGGEAEANDLDVEAHRACWQSMNIGVMHFPPGARAGAIAAIEQAVAHLSEENNLRRVDQGPINFRWKFGAGKWRWARQLHAVDKRLCGLVNGTVVGAVLPSAQFCNTLTYSVLKLWRPLGVRPFAVHATWMRQQLEQFKLMRLREETLWNDPPEWYGALHGDATGGSSVPAAGFLTYDHHLPAEAYHVPRIERGAVPLHHIRLMMHQLRQLRNALFIARALGRALVLPKMMCACEIGFWPNHIEEECRAADHTELSLPYECVIDHFLDPVALAASPFLHRERTFLANPRTPLALRANLTRVVPCAAAACPRGEAQLSVAPRASLAQLARQLRAHPARVLHFADVRAAIGSFGRAAAGEPRLDARRFHADAQALLSSWCCTADPAFKRSAGVVPFLLPWLEGQAEWTGDTRLDWAAKALAERFDAANDSASASALRPPRPWEA